MKAKLRLIFQVAMFCTFAALSAFGQQNTPRLKGYTTVVPGPSMTQSMENTTTSILPLWSFDVESSRDHKHYTGVMVGTDPFNGGSGQTNVPTQIIPVTVFTHRIAVSVNSNGILKTEPGETVFNPSVPLPSCLRTPNDVPLTLFQQSPIFEPADFNYGGTDVGRSQTTDAFQRANFWNVINRASYSVQLSLVATLPSLRLDVPSAQGVALATTALGPPAFCAPLGIVNIIMFDSLVKTQILPSLAARGVNPSTFPIFLFSNVVLSAGEPELNNCCILGYHGAGDTTSPFQTYSPLDFDSTGLFGVGGRDTAVASHEVGEWMDDPFGNNPVPPWGHIGQQPGCQGNLEVGDPLTGNEAPRIAMPNGFTYHLQELAFFSWFFGEPSIGVNGWFSDNGTFLTDAGPPCH